MRRIIGRDLQAAAHVLGVQLHILHASSEPEFDTAFATLVRLQAGDGLTLVAVILPAGWLFWKLVRVLARLQVPPQTVV